MRRWGSGRSLGRRTEVSENGGAGRGEEVEATYVDDRTVKAPNIRPMVIRKAAPYGPVGLIAVKFPGCQIHGSRRRGRGFTLAVAGKTTVRRVVVHASWDLAAVLEALSSKGRYYWHRGEWIDDFAVADARNPPPSPGSLIRDADLSYLQQVFPEVP